MIPGPWIQTETLPLEPPGIFPQSAAGQARLFADSDIVAPAVRSLWAIG